MISLWLYRLFLLIAAASLLLVGGLVATDLPKALAANSADVPEIIAWGVAVAIGTPLLLAAILLRRRGWTRLAAALAGIVALPGLFGLALVAVVIGAFMAK